MLTYNIPTESLIVESQLRGYADRGDERRLADPTTAASTSGCAPDSRIPVPYIVREGGKSPTTELSSSPTALSRDHENSS